MHCFIKGSSLNNAISFRCYAANDKDACLRLFDENCPAFFSPNERADYAQFLDAAPSGYEVCMLDGAVIGAYGLVGADQAWRHLNWILISAKVQGLGIGSVFIDRTIRIGKAANIVGIKIAASHLSAPFFAKNGAVQLRMIENGWGIGMHRIDMELKL
jgi:GNAT superfamily N-acetyltransferase